MADENAAPRRILGRSNVHRRTAWFGDSVVSGFIATFAMTVTLVAAFGLSRAIGDEDGSLLERWLWALTHNPVEQAAVDAVVLALALNLLMGLTWAVVYGYLVEPRLPGPGWRRGILFALGPWVLSVVAFLPIMGGGFLGADIGAGPLPVLGNLVLHLVYGAVLGSVYAIDIGEWTEGTEIELAHARAQLRGAAIGIIVGITLGTVIGWLLGPTLDEAGSRALITVVGALSGGALGALWGSFLGIERIPRHGREPGRSEADQDERHPSSA